MTTKSQNHFDLIVLGSGGGVDESNLSAYLLSASSEDGYLCMDAGTLMHGLKLASHQGHFKHLDAKEHFLELPAHVLHHHIAAYAISHPHLDHVNGMLLAAPFDNHKSIFSSVETADALLKHVFLSPLWGNFSNEGENAIGKWRLERMETQKWYPVLKTSMTIQIFPLCHSCPNESSAFLIKNKDAYCLYFGDTGSDKIEGQNRLKKIFQEISPLIHKQQLKALLIEVSFPNHQSNDQLYGHLKPILLEQELQNLASIVDSVKPESALSTLKIMINHIKPNFQRSENSIKIISQELNEINTFGAEMILLKQSEKYTF